MVILGIQRWEEGQGWRSWSTGAVKNGKPYLRQDSCLLSGVFFPSWISLFFIEWAKNNNNKNQCTPRPSNIPMVPHSYTNIHMPCMNMHPLVPQVIMSQEMRVSLSDVPDLPEGSNITIRRTFPCVFQGWQQVAKVAVSLATGRWEELRPQEGQMVLVEKLQKGARRPVTQQRGRAKHGGPILGLPNHLKPHHFIQSYKHSVFFGIMASRMVVWTGPDDKGAAFASRAWNKQALRQEEGTENGAAHLSPIPTPPLGTVKLFHPSASHSPQPACLHRHSQLFTCTLAHTENPISPSSFSILFVMLTVRTLSHMLRSQQPGTVSPWQDNRQPLSLL